MKNYIFLIIILLQSCAIFVPPTGGEKDEKGPELLKIYPEVGSLNFKDSKLEFEFDELIDASQLRQELVVSPALKKNYKTKVKNNILTILLNENLEPNTTYYFNFRNSIKDLNERNVAKNIKAIFSTGETIDSLNVSGKLKNLWDLNKPKNGLVFLLEEKLDSLPYLNRQPSYFTTVDTSGIFQFNYIKNGNYKLISFNDSNNNLKYDSKEETFGFLDSTIILNKDINNLEVYLSKMELEKPRIQQSISRTNNFDIRLRKPIDKIKVQYINSKDSLTYKQLNATTIRFFNHPTTKDSISINLTVVDSSRIDTTFNTKIYFDQEERKEKTEILKITTNSKEVQKTAKVQAFQINFEQPIIAIDTQKIQLTNSEKINLKFQIKPLDKSNTQFIIDPTTKTEKEILLQINSNAFTSYTSDTSSIIKIEQHVLDKNELGTIKGFINNPDSIQLIVQLYTTDDNKLQEEQVIFNKYEFKNLIPKDYILKIIQDLNSNSFWDQADYIQNKYAEPVFIKPEIIKLKSNFEIEINVDNLSG